MRPRVSASSTAAVIGDSDQRRQINRLADSERIDDVANRGRQRSNLRFDQFHQAGRHDRLADPPPIAMLLHEPTVPDLPLDDVAKVQDVAARQLPQPMSGLRIH